nr:hypothetical protein [uncultured Dongia sp.]
MDRDDARALAGKSRGRFGKIVGLSLFGFAAVAVPAALAAYPVTDAGNLVQNTMTALNSVKQLGELVKILSEAQNIFGAVGKAKAAVNSIVPSSYSNVGTQVNAATPRFDSWGLAKDVAPNISSVNKAIDFIQGSLDVPPAKDGKKRKEITADAQADILRRRSAANKEIMFRALGTAQNAIATAQDASNTANSIVTAGNTDLREQTAQAIQATVGNTQELIQIRVLLATQLELQAAGLIAGQPVSVTAARKPSETAEGDSGDVTSPFGN